MLTKLGLFPEQASTMAAEVDALYFFLIAVSVFFGLLIATLIVVFSFRYRRTQANREPKQIEGSLILEGLWSFIPFVIAMTIFVWSASVYLALTRPPDDALEIFVVGKQWMWKIQHMEGRREINELHVPVGRPVKLTMTSEDVIHSFFVPAFRVKSDVVPGRYTSEWFEATKPGSYHLFCAEYCGTEHSRMIGKVIAMEPHEYQLWLRDGGTHVAGTTAAAGAVTVPLSLAEAGARVFNNTGCQTCHAVDEMTDTALMNGPALYGLFGTEISLNSGGTVVMDEAYIRKSIVDPMSEVVAGYRPLMPTYAGRVSEEEILQLIAYIKSLGVQP
jgi:cytochrome c oxidase subunit 2